MIYIITPYKRDFELFCESRYLNCLSECKWVESLDQIRGLTLYKGDFFDFPSGFNKFPLHVQEIFKAEIHLLHTRVSEYERPRKIVGAEYVATLPDGYEWLFMKIGEGFGLIGAHPEKPPIAYRLDGLTWTPCEIVFNPEAVVATPNCP